MLADTSQLHTKIAEMGQRIRELEDALAIFQASVSNETHSLLREELLSIKFGPEKGHVSQKEPPARKESSEPPIDAFGTMTMGEGGEGKYFGPSAGSEVRRSHTRPLTDIDKYVGDKIFIPCIQRLYLWYTSFSPFHMQ